MVGKEMLEKGDMEKGTLAAGQCMGLIRDIPSCQELLDRIMNEAETLIRERFAGVFQA
jgi:nitronate monooxygenase